MENSVNETTDANSDKNDNEIVKTKPLLEIKPYDQSLIEKNNITQKSLPLIPSLKDQVGNIVKLAPQTKELIKKEKTLVLRFNNDVIEKFKTGEFHLMKSKNSLNEYLPIAVDGKHKIRAHGRLGVKEIKKINPTQVKNLALGAMTVITAQEHLDRINKQLVKLDEKVDILVRNISQEKRGNIQGNIKYLKTLMPDILQDSFEFKSSNYNMIESICGVR